MSPVLPNHLTYSVHTSENRTPGLKVIDIHNPVEIENNEERPILFVIHGWRSNRDEKWVQKITYAALDGPNFVVVQVDWRDVAKSLYTSAASSVKPVGT